MDPLADYNDAADAEDSSVAEGVELKKGSWAADEDEQLIALVKAYGALVVSAQRSPA